MEYRLAKARVAGSNPVSCLSFTRNFNFIQVLEREHYARVAQWWSIALPRRGSRVRIPSRAFFVPKNKYVYFSSDVSLAIFVFVVEKYIIRAHAQVPRKTKSKLIICSLPQTFYNSSGGCDSGCKGWKDCGTRYS